MARNTTATAEREHIINAPLGLRLRKEPNGEIITILSNKSGVFCMEDATEEWVSVRTGELYGYVKSEFLRPAEGGDA